MAHREVTMLEVKEVLRLWLEGVAKKRICFWPGAGREDGPEVPPSILELFGWARAHGGLCLLVDPLNQRTRVMSCTQFVSQVLPSSGESACSQWHDVGLMLDQMKRARTRFPWTVSFP
jgi:hypothetical protein